MLIRHTVIYLLGRGLTAAASLALLLLLVRAMTKEQYGYYALLMSSGGMVSAVLFQWLSISMARFIASEDIERDKLLATVTGGFLFMLALTVPIPFLFSHLFVQDLPSHLPWLALVVSWALAWFDLSQRLVNANLAPVRYVIMGATKSTLALLLSVLVVLWTTAAEGAILALVVSLLIASLGAKVYWSGTRPTKFDREIFTRLLRYGAPLTMTYVLVLVIDASDRYFIAGFLGAAAVGEYAPVYDLSQQSLGMLMGVIYLAANPLVLRALQTEGEEAARQRIVDTGRLLIGIALPVTAGVVMESGTISQLLLGPGVTSESAAVLAIVAVAVFVGGVRAYYFDFSFQLKARLSVQVWVFVGAACANLLLNYLLIPVYGLVGAAISTLAAFTLSTVLSCYVGGKIFRLPLWHAELPRIVFATAVMAGYLYICRSNGDYARFFVNTLVALTLYGTATYALDVGGARRQCARLYNRIVS